MERKKKASDLFRARPECLNCAQTLLKAWQDEAQIPQALVESFKAMGGGRTPNGTCGAFYSAELVAGFLGVPSILAELKQDVGTLSCEEIRGNKIIPCEECVEKADRLIENRLKEK